LPGDPIILVMTKSGSTYEIQSLEVIMNILSEALATLEKWPQVENHRHKVFTPRRNALDFKHATH